MKFKSKSNYKKGLKNGGLTTSQLNLTAALESIFDTGKDVFPQKYPDGGLITAPAVQESTSVVRPLVLQFQAPLLTAAQKADTMTEMDFTGNPMFGDSNKKKSNDRYREKAQGGRTGVGQSRMQNELDDNQSATDAISGALGVIPVFGQFLSPIAKVLGNSFGENIKERYDTQPDQRTTTNVYGNMATGGAITNNFKQYNTGSHNSGQDLAIDVNGNGNSNASGGYVQNDENAYRFNDGTVYVMSDTLVNPETGNLFNKDASTVNKKYNKADTISEEKNAMDFEMSRLSKLNDAMRNVKDQVMKALGGSTHADGDPVRNRAWVDASGQIHYPDDQLTIEPIKSQAAVPSAVNPLDYLDVPQYESLAQDITNPVPGNPTEIKNTPTFKETYTLDGLVRSNSTNTDTTDGEATTTEEEDDKLNLNPVAVALKAIALGKSFNEANKQPEKETPILPNYNKADAQMYKANIDFTQSKQDAVAASNLMSNVNRSSSSGFQSYQGRQAMNFANLADQIGRISEQENLQRSQLALTRSQYESNKAVDKANRLYQNRIDNQQNKAVSDLAKEKFFTELSQVGTTINEYQYYRDMLKNQKEIAQAKIKESAAILGSKYENFGFSQEFINKVSNGDYSNLDFNEVIRFISTADKVKKDKG